MRQFFTSLVRGRNSKFLVVGGGVLSLAYYGEVHHWLFPHLKQDVKNKVRTKRLFYSLEGPEHMANYVPPPVVVPSIKQNPIVLPKPKKHAELPGHVTYLIIGSGAAGFAASRAIRGGDAESKVLVIGEENNLPYMRPPLSKELWLTEDRKIVEQLQYQQFTGRNRSIFLEKDEFFCDPSKLNEKEHGGVSVVTGRKVVSLDVVKHEATLEDGFKIKYEKCLIATGGTPKILKEIADGGDDVLKRVTLYRKLEDFCKVDEIAQNVKSLVIVGGGFLGTELACSLAHKTKGSDTKITQIIRESGNMGKFLPEYLSKWTSDRIRRDGVTILDSATIEKATSASNRVTLQLKDGRQVDADHVILAVGIEPNVELAKSAGLEVDPKIGGFTCDSELRARTDVWVAGDCCSFYDPLLGRRRVEHQDHAAVSGRLAGENMTGSAKPYKHQSMFWSDIGTELGLEAVGLVDSSLPTVGVFAKAGESENLDGTAEVTKSSDIPIESENQRSDYDKGVMFYLREKKIVGILLWNLYSRISIARRILNEDVIFDDLNEVAKLFNIHDAPPVALPKKG